MEPKRILLAGNEPETALFIEHEMNNLGLAVDTVVDGDEAWKLVQTGRYIILICDEKVLGMNSLKLAWQIRQNVGLCSIPIIYVVDEEPKQEIFSCPRSDVDVTLRRETIAEIVKYVPRILAYEENAGRLHYGQR